MGGSVCQEILRTKILSFLNVVQCAKHGFVPHDEWVTCVQYISRENVASNRRGRYSAPTADLSARALKRPLHLLHTGDY